MAHTEQREEKPWKARDNSKGEAKKKKKKEIFLSVRMRHLCAGNDLSVYGKAEGSLKEAHLGNSLFCTGDDKCWW